VEEYTYTMKSYLFKIVIEKDEDVYHAYCPALKGASTWGYTKEEAIRNIQEVIQMVVESMIEHGELIPETSTEQVQILLEPAIAVNI